MKSSVDSWGRYPRLVPKSVLHPSRVDDIRIDAGTNHTLAYGKGRSYGDVCLNEGGTIIRMDSCANVIHFDTHEGWIRAESGITLAAILRTIIPQGWFLPVTPGTKFVTLGGALANDVHGKNHHGAGTIGNFIRAFGLLRSDGSHVVCSAAENINLYRATIGGMGLTGIVTWVELALTPIVCDTVEAETVKVGSLSEALDVGVESDSQWEYTVTWVDVTAPQKSLGRGIVSRGRFSGTPGLPPSIEDSKPLLNVPFEAPNWLLSKPTISLFNRLWYAKQMRKLNSGAMTVDAFFYPLDGVGNWNLLYGSRGMLQYQCVVPHDGGIDVLSKIIAILQKADVASFLAVVKTFGDKPSPGIMSFPRKGITLSLDMPNTGKRLFDALDRCDELVYANGGRVYAAKDARVRGEMFRLMYPEIEEFQQHIDPAFSSSFWRRVMKYHKEKL